MASIQKTASGYRVQISILAKRESATFKTKREAESWAARRETEIRQGVNTHPGNTKTLRDVFRRYSENESTAKRGERWEIIRLAAFESHKLPLDKKIASVTTEDLGLWRDDRLKKVMPGTVLRDIGLLAAVFEAARREWDWIDTNPIRDLRKPPSPRHRTITLTRAQIKAMLRQLDYGGKVKSVTQAVGCCFLLALRTGMRAGEICNLKWENLGDGYCDLPMTKNGKARKVPITPKAQKVIDLMKGFDKAFVFGIKTQTLDALFRKARMRAGLDGFTFHDARRTAATRISKQVDVLMLCRIFGWSDPKMAMVYYAPTTQEMLKLLT